MRVAIIPARGGSKRIPRKNIRDFRGKPAIAWSIAVAQKSSLFDKIVVSTEDSEISDVARSYGAEVPFRRPAKLADDSTTTVEAVAHAVQSCLELGWNIDLACCIYPCSPFIEVADLVRAVELAEERAADYVYPVTTYPHPVQRAMRMLADSSMRFITPEFELTGTQHLEELYHDVGQFYVGKPSAWLARSSILTAGLAIPIPSWRVVDIDTPEDWKRAELLHVTLFPEGSSLAV
jgi:pseudaminic acid cytidylyltransferase